MVAGVPVGRTQRPVPGVALSCPMSRLGHGGWRDEVASMQLVKMMAYNCIQLLDAASRVILL